MRCVAGRAPFGLYWSVFIGERTLLVRVTLDTSCIPACCEPGLFEFEATMRVMTITATHGSFQNLVVKGRRKCRLDLAVATQAKLRVVHLQHSDA